MSSNLLWKPQKNNTDVESRAAVKSASLQWYQANSLKSYQANLTGIWFGSFESNCDIQEHPVTMLTRFDRGGFFPLHSHPGGEEILVLEGNFQDETGVHPPGTYMLNPEGFIHAPYSNEGCLTFVKLRQHGGTTRNQVRTNIYESSWQPGLIPGIEVKLLYQQDGYSEKVWIERWQPGVRRSDVVETEVKEIFVIEGTWNDELGSYPQRSWLRYPPNCPYNPASETGCLIYVKTYSPDETRRFVVGEDFRQPN